MAAKKGKRRRKPPAGPFDQFAAAIQDVTLEGITSFVHEATGFVNSVSGALAARNGQSHVPPAQAPNGSHAPNAHVEVLKARATLGLDWPCTAQQVKAAHRKMVQLMHTDRGGDANMAARVNTARDTLLRALGAT